MVCFPLINIILIDKYFHRFLVELELVFKVSAYLFLIMYSLTWITLLLIVDFIKTLMRDDYPMISLSHSII